MNDAACTALHHWNPQYTPCSHKWQTIYFLPVDFAKRRYLAGSDTSYDRVERCLRCGQEREVVE